MHAHQRKEKLVTTYKEFPTTVWTVLLLQTYLEPGCSIIHMNHEAFKWMLASPDASRKPARCRLRLLELDIEVVHRANTKHQAPYHIKVKNRRDKPDQPRRGATGTHDGLDQKWKGDAETEYFDKDRSCTKWQANLMDIYRKE